MTVFYSALNESYLGYSAIFVCLGIGFWFLRQVVKGEIGPGYWAISFLLSGVGFFFWSGLVALTPLQFYLTGEIFHIGGFFFLVCGVYRFSGNRYQAWNFIALFFWICIWIFSIVLINYDNYLAALLLKALRALLFISSGIMVIRNTSGNFHRGKGLAGVSLIFWGVYISVFAFIKIETFQNLYFGFLVGFQIVAAFGMVVLVLDRIRIRAEDNEKKLMKLEGLLPICSYCKNIKDVNNSWQPLEQYIQGRSSTEFTHGICPDCMKKHYPDVT
jgi:hypothetical protein